MDYSVDLSNSNGGPHMVVVRVYTPATERMTLRFLREAVVTARRHGLESFLVDTRLATCRRTAVDDYELAYRHLGELGFTRQSRAAFLVAPGDESHGFLETVAHNAGYSWRLFTEKHAALKWLGQ